MSSRQEHLRPGPGLELSPAQHQMWNFGGARNAEIVESIKGAEEVALTEFVDSMVENITNSSEQTFFAFVSGATGAGKGTVAQAVQDGIRQSQQEESIITRTLSTSIISKAYIANNPTDKVQGTFPPEVYEGITQLALQELKLQIERDEAERKAGKKIVYLIEAGAVIDIPTDNFFEDLLKNNQLPNSNRTIEDIVQKMQISPMKIADGTQQQNRLISLGAALSCLPTTYMFLLHRDDKLHKGISDARTAYEAVYNHAYRSFHSREDISQDEEQLRGQLFTTFFQNVDVHIDLGEGKRITSQEIEKLPLKQMLTLVEFILNTMNTPEGITHNNDLQDKAVAHLKKNRKDLEVKKVEDLYRVFKNQLVAVNETVNPGNTLPAAARIWRGVNHPVKKKSKKEQPYKPVMILNYFADSIGMPEGLKKKYETVREYMVGQGHYQTVEQAEKVEPSISPLEKVLQQYEEIIGNHYKRLDFVVEEFIRAYQQGATPQLEILDGKAEGIDGVFDTIQQFVVAADIDPSTVAVIRWKEIYDKSPTNNDEKERLSQVNTEYQQQCEKAHAEGKIVVGVISEEGLLNNQTINLVSEGTQTERFVIAIFDENTTLGSEQTYKLNTIFNPQSGEKKQQEKEKEESDTNIINIDVQKLEEKYNPEAFSHDIEITPENVYSLSVQYIVGVTMKNTPITRALLAKKY